MLYTVMRQIEVEASTPEEAIAKCDTDGRRISVSSTVKAQQLPREDEKPLPRDQWPMWTNALAIVAKPQDKGIGDVVARTIGHETSEAFKAFYRKVTGKECGCAGRQAKWNKLYPL